MISPLGALILWNSQLSVPLRGSILCSGATDNCIILGVDYEENKRNAEIAAILLEDIASALRKLFEEKD